MIVVADTSPLRYLILIEAIGVLPALYGRVIVPPGVVAELNQERTPSVVRDGMSRSSGSIVLDTTPCHAA